MEKQREGQPMTAAAVVIPVMIAIIIACGLYKRVDVFSEFAAGARENLTTCAELLPTLIALITAVGMFRASGAGAAVAVCAT